MGPECKHRFRKLCLIFCLHDNEEHNDRGHDLSLRTLLMFSCIILMVCTEFEFQKSENTSENVSNVYFSFFSTSSSQICVLLKKTKKTRQCQINIYFIFFTPKPLNFIYYSNTMLLYKTRLIVYFKNHFE